MAVAITNENFEALVLKGDKPVILDFWAEWCGPCRMMTPVIDELAEENPDLLIGKVNVDKNMELALRFGITSIPTLIAFRDGDVVGQAVGVRSKEEVLALLGYEGTEMYFFFFHEKKEKVPKRKKRNPTQCLRRGKGNIKCKTER